MSPCSDGSFGVPEKGRPFFCGRLKKPASFVLTSKASSTKTRSPQHSAARTNLVLLIFVAPCVPEVTPRVVSSAPALLGTRRVLACQGWVGEKSGLFEPPARTLTFYVNFSIPPHQV